MSAAARTAAPRGTAETTSDEVDPTPWPVALLLAALGGVCALLAFPPYDLWMLLPVALALFSAALLVRTVRLAVLVSLVWGLAFFVPLTQWASTYAGWMPWLALGVFEALYMVVYGLAARTVMVRRGLSLSSAIVVAALWTAVELLRGTVPWGGLTWGSAAFALGDSPLLNLGPWVGMSGLAFVTALLGQLLVHGALSLLGRRHRGLVGFSGVWPLAIAVAAVLATVLTPYPANRAPEGRPTMRIVGVQGSMERIDPATMAMPEGVFENHLETTHQVIADAEADGTELGLIVWPEDSTGYDPRQDPWLAQQLAAASTEAGAPILIGTQSAVGDTQRLNESVLVTPDGSMPYSYAKRHPVPFGEYVPFRDFFRTLTDKVDLVGRDMIPGEEVGVLDLGAVGQGEGSVGVLICFEIAYQDLVGDVVEDGAEVIVVQSNNALFGDSHEAIQQLAEAKVMAVVSGRSVVHVSTVGHSAIFTPEGRQLDFVDHWDQGAVVADVPLRTGTTLAVAAGPWIGVGISAVAVLGLLGALSTSRRALARPRPRRSTRT
ncbi:apolipoprotein N-acyltransferase [Brachybacterium sp. J153]|uniref:apolipoprotein N-acyltransferase n=1 Tax=Brachybacterium sp. J153 TaxID=3116488 RepID=UPI002E777176|nr:apolipoprotein N-acyltransferase [Brachybacterium sp. J153]MEE1617412.1 apolipoprotein N-acyltransferase [Brachybacterium sp. J153]